MRLRIVWIILALVFVLVPTGLTHFSLSALQEPGPVETRAANDAKNIFISPSEPPGNSSAAPRYKCQH